MGQKPLENINLVESLNAAIAMLLAELQKLHSYNKELSDKFQDIELQKTALEAKIKTLVKSTYGRKSEKISYQNNELYKLLFPDGELINDKNSQEIDHEIQKISQDSNNLNNKLVNTHGRGHKPQDLPKVEIVYDIDESDKKCKNCSDSLTLIGSEDNEQYHYDVSVKLVKHIRQKYACKNCKANVVTAKKPEELINKCNATPEMIAYIATEKFGYHQPLTRLENKFKAEGAKISKQTMCDWLIKTAKLLLLVQNRTKEKILQSKKIHTDDTTVNLVKNSTGKKNKNVKTSRIWTYVGDKEHNYTVYDFTENRKSEGPENFLIDYKGYLQADAYSGYDQIYAKGIIKEVGCWAHARRYFKNIEDIAPEKCITALSIIQKLYKIETEVKGLTYEEIKAARQEKSLPILKAFRDWLIKESRIELPKSQLNKAINYCLNNYDSLMVYTQEGFLDIDNNEAERAIKPIVIGRKNWLFFASNNGGHTAAIFASIIQSCKQNGVNPSAYLTYVIKKLADKSYSDIDDLLIENFKNKF